MPPIRGRGRGGTYSGIATSPGNKNKSPAPVGRSSPMENKNKFGKENEEEVKPQLTASALSRPGGTTNPADPKNAAAGRKTQYLMSESRNALRFQYQMDCEEYDPTEPNMLDYKSLQALKRTKISTKQRMQDERRKHRRVLEGASYLCRIVINVMRALSEEKKPPDVERALALLEQMHKVGVTPAMVKFAPMSVYMSRKCSGYEHNKDIRDLGRKCYDKFQSMFAVPEGETFESVFTKEVNRVKFMDKDERH